SRNIGSRPSGNRINRTARLRSGPRSLMFHRQELSIARSDAVHHECCGVSLREHAACVFFVESGEADRRHTLWQLLFLRNLRPRRRSASSETAHQRELFSMITQSIILITQVITFWAGQMASYTERVGAFIGL